MACLSNEGTQEIIVVEDTICGRHGQDNKVGAGHDASDARNPLQSSFVAKYQDLISWS